MAAASLKTKTLSGMIWSFVQRFGTMAISFVSNIVLARLLTPDDYGTIGMLMIFMQLLSILPINKSNIPPLLEYYESSDANSLTRKISSIPAFQTIKSPMKQIENGWIPDFESRYFTEEFPFGLKIIKDLAIQYGLHTPTIDEVYKWGNKVIHSNY